MAASIKIKRGSGTPSGLTFGEPAFDATNNKLFVGVTSSQIWVGAEVDNGDLNTNSQIKIPTQYAVKQYVDGFVAGGAVTTVNGETGSVSIAAGSAIDITTTPGSKTITVTNQGVRSLAGTTNQISVSGATGTVTVSLPPSLVAPGSVTVTTDLTVSGNLTVNGTTTTVNSDITTVDDPLMLLGTSGGVPIAASDGGKDRGIAFTYYDGSQGRTGFFGMDSSETKFTFIPVATISGDIVSSGSVGSAQFKTLFLTNDGTNLGGLTLATLSSTRTYTLPDHTGTVVVPSDLGTSGYILKANGASSQPTWIDASSAGFTAYAATRLATARSINLTGEVTGTVSFDGTSDVNISTTIAANSVELGTDTTGNYVATLSTTSSGLTIGNSGTETAAVTVNFTKINSGIDFGTFAFTTNEFTNNGSGTVSIGVVDGGSY